MSTNLADILRFCISPAEFVPLRREMEILERYVEIQRIRLSDSFAYEAQVPEALLDCLVPKMLLHCGASRWARRADGSAEAPG